MGALGWVCHQCIIPEFDNGPDSGDILPSDRDAEPSVGRPPSPRADQKIRTLFVYKTGVEGADLPGNGLGGCRVEIRGFDKDDVGYFFIQTMAEGLAGGAEGLGAFILADLHVKTFLPRDHRPYLQKIEIAFLHGSAHIAGSAHIDGKFDLNRAAHACSAKIQQFGQEGRQGELVVFKHLAKGQNQRALMGAVTDSVLLRDIGAAKGFYRQVREGVGEVPDLQVGLPVEQEGGCISSHLKGIKFSLTVGQDVVDR